MEKEKEKKKERDVKLRLNLSLLIAHTNSSSGIDDRSDNDSECSPSIVRFLARGLDTARKREQTRLNNQTLKVWDEKESTYRLGW